MTVLCNYLTTRSLHTADTEWRRNDLYSSNHRSCLWM